MASRQGAERPLVLADKAVKLYEIWLPDLPAGGLIWLQTSQASSATVETFPVFLLVLVVALRERSSSCVPKSFG